jgi:hypothetical protein
MREAISKTLSASLDWDDSEHERAIDKLTAFSFSDRLGTLLWRVKYFNDASSYKPAILILAKRLPRLNRGIAIKVSEQALREWLYNHCGTCLGAREVRQGDHVITCPSCQGGGVRKYTDRERHQAIGANMSRHIDQVLNIIGGMDVQVSVQTRIRLEK